MRFLNTHTLQFELVPDSELHLEENQYAILSHRWGADKDEVSFEDVLSLADLSHIKAFDKIKGFCKVALSEKCRYGWVDTCCIHKKDSAELSEAINSMYRWYQGSKICIVYLEDVPQKQLMGSEWFDRGWTLQEMIAPRAVSFFDQGWSLIGTKIDLVLDLSRKTRIPEGVMNNTIEPSACSIAQRMSWAANRRTTREEDRAYSLMGLFDIYMPMIYGEREKAFLRLQQQIIQKSKDESIFAWDMEFPGNTKAYSGLFSPSPLAYASCSDIIQTSGSRGFSESNGELSIWSRVLPHSPGTYVAGLHCTDRAFPESRTFILISNNTSTEGEFVRVRNAKKFSQGLIQTGDLGLIQTGDLARYQEWQIRVPVAPTEPPVSIFNGFWLRTLQPPGHDKCQTTLISNCQPPEADYVCQHDYDQGVAGVVHIDPKKSANRYIWSQVHWLTFSFDRDFNPVLWLANGEHSGWLQYAFEQAVASGAGSLECRQLMRTCKKDTQKPWPGNWTSANGVRLSRRDKSWPQGALTMTVDRKTGIQGIIINSLNLKVSVQLQHFLNPATISAENVNDGEIPVNSMNIWVVDIVDIEGTSPEEKDCQSIERREERDRESRELEHRNNKRENKNCCMRLIMFLSLLALLIILGMPIVHNFWKAT